MPRKRTPDDSTLESELREAVRQIYKREQLNLTVNAARQAAEEKLSLEDGFFRAGGWKMRSKEIVHETLVGCPAALVVGWKD
jgi:hypothetical protein